jgi:ectoine hydroxylase-related dioxygenase (phytanoyl-CoA dioxygenase family)
MSVSTFSAPIPDTALGRQFAEHGFVVVKGVFSPAEVAVLEADFDRIVAQLVASGEDINAKWGGDVMEKMADPGSVVIHTHNVQHYSAVWTQAFLHEKFLKAATDLLGPDVVLHHSKLFQKPAEKGAPFPMHQDWDYFPSKLDTMLAGIIHVSSATDEMGCLRVYPGSHKAGRIDDSKGHSGWIEETYPLEGATPLEAEPGDVVFFHYLTWHGSKPNRSDKVRKTVLVQLHAGADELENPAGHPYERTVLAGFNPHMTRNNANSVK